MNTKALFVSATLALGSAMAVPADAQQRDVHITMEVLDDVSDIDAVILALEDERSGGDLERAGRDADTSAHREAAADAERADRSDRDGDAGADRGARSSDERVDEREDSIEDRNLERDLEIELDPELDASEDAATDAPQ